MQQTTLPKHKILEPRHDDIGDDDRDNDDDDDDDDADGNDEKIHIPKYHHQHTLLGNHKTYTRTRTKTDTTLQGVYAPVPEKTTFTHPTHPADSNKCMISNQSAQKS